MYELVKLTDHNYYIESPAKVGLVVLENNQVVVIDSGNDKDAGKKIKKILDANGWSLKAIYNTHSHSDHIGGNQYLQKQTGCEIFASEIEADFTRHPILEPSLLYGGNPIKELKHKFLMAQPSQVTVLTEEVLPTGWQVIPLYGHSFDMVGFRTAEDVVYLADCLSSTQTLDKYKIGFIYDVEAYLDTLENVKQMKARYFVPSHTDVLESVVNLAQLNIDKVFEVCETIADICKNPKTFEQILKEVFERFSLQMTYEQHALVGSTVRSYLTYLCNQGRIVSEILDNSVVWRQR